MPARDVSLNNFTRVYSTRERIMSRGEAPMPPGAGTRAFLGHSSFNNSLEKLSKIRLPQHPLQMITGIKSVSTVAREMSTHRDVAFPYTSAVLLATLCLCLVGALLQMYQILNNYLKYEMMSEVNFFKEDFVRPPAFSICFSYVELIDFSGLNTNDTQIDVDFWNNITSNKEREVISDHLQQQLTIKQIFDRTPNLTDLLINGWVRRANSYEVNYDNFEDMKSVKYVKDDLVCYAISHAGQNGSSRSDNFHLRSHHITYGQEPGTQMMVTLDRSKVNHVSKAVAYLHPFDQLPRGDADFPFNYISNEEAKLFTKASSYIGLTYQKININLLPAPYGSGCHNYSHRNPGQFGWTLDEKKRVTFESEYHCIHYCLRYRTLKFFNETSFTSTFGDALDIQIMTKHSIYQSMEKEVNFDRIFDSCQNSCSGKSCVKSIFMPALVAVRESDEVTFMIYDMAGLETTATFKPKILLVELLVQVLSVSGVWLGVSCVDFVSTFTQSLGSCFLAGKNDTNQQSIVHWSKPMYKRCRVTPVARCVAR